MNTWRRVCGMAAIAGGLLRIANIAMAQLPQDVLAAVYFATDMLLLAGVAGLWMTRRAAVGPAATLGLAVFVAGILAVRASAFGVGTYSLGAAIALAGLAIYSVGALWTRRVAMWAPVFWLAAVPPAVTAAFGGTGSFPMAVLAAAMFGAGFILAGIEMLSASRGGARPSGPCFSAGRSRRRSRSRPSHG